jgi:hypothetical protein
VSCSDGPLSQVLVLSATVMMKWRDEQAKAMLAHMTGDRLALRSGGRAAQEVFLSEVKNK